MYLFALFNSPEHLKYFSSFLISYLANIPFTIKSEDDHKISFLDLEVIYYSMNQVNLQPWFTANPNFQNLFQDIFLQSI